MPAVLVAVALGLLVGLVSGGRIRNIGARPYHQVPLLVLGLALPVGAELADLAEGPARALVLAGQLSLVLFASANLSLVGMPIVLIGLVLNAMVMAANGAMPVRAEAVVWVLGDGGGLEQVDLGVERRLEEPDDLLVVLADIVPLRPLGEVVSFGDLILAVGLANVAFRMVKPRSRAV